MAVEKPASKSQAFRPKLIEGKALPIPSVLRKKHGDSGLSALKTYQKTRVCLGCFFSYFFAQYVHSPTT